MFQNPLEQWQRLAAHYRELCDEELLALADAPEDLTETARQVLAAELQTRGLKRNAAPAAKIPEPIVHQQLAQKAEDPCWRSAFGAARDNASFSMDPMSFIQEQMPGEMPLVEEQNEASDSEEASGQPCEMTWKTTLCDCETAEQALLLAEALRQKGVDAWAEGPRTSMRWELSFNRVQVAADQLEEARRIAAQPIPAEVVCAQQQAGEEEPEYVPPVCPSCAAPDPVLEAVNQENQWFCEVCGKHWTE